MVEPTLRQLQQWVQAVLVHPHGAGCGVESAEATRYLDIPSASVGQVILASSTLEPIERLDVYARMYPLRMRDALATDYPVLKASLAPEAWSSLVDAYVQTHPSVHPNLNQLGRQLPRYIRSLHGLGNLPFLADLAELELAMTLAFDAEDSLPLDARALATLQPREWSGAVFIPAPAFQLRAFAYPVNAYLQAVKEGARPLLPDAAPTFTAIYRKSWSVWRKHLSEDEYRMLQLLVQGRPAGKALKKLQRDRGLGPEELAASVRAWFQDWIEEGFFSRVELP